MVFAQLTASVGMNEAVDAVHAVAVSLLRHALERFGGSVDTADGIYNPDLVADADAPILADVAFKRRAAVERHGARVRMIAVFQQTGKVGLDVMGVYPAARRNGQGRMTDGKAVFDDVLVFGDVGERELMPRGDILKQGNAQHGFAGFQRFERDGDVVAGLNADESAHACATTSSIAFAAPLVKMASRDLATDASKPGSSAVRSLPQKSTFVSTACAISAADFPV